MKKIKILIADDHPVFLFGLRAIINQMNDCFIVNIASDGKRAYKLICKIIPDLVILDIDMPHLNGIQIANKLGESHPRIKIVFLTVNKDESIFNFAFRSGARGYVLKDNAATDIVRCINTVFLGKIFISPQMRSFYNHMTTINSTVFDLINRLTDTEKVVLHEVSKNKSSSDIASKLSITNKTVHNHRFNICKKMNLEGVNSLLTYSLLNKQTIDLILLD
jgi:DNA-binding NarL/FixJ family response regulator